MRWSWKLENASTRGSLPRSGISSGKLSTTVTKRKRKGVRTAKSADSKPPSPSSDLFPNAKPKISTFRDYDVHANKTHEECAIQRRVTTARRLRPGEAESDFSLDSRHGSPTAGASGGSVCNTPEGQEKHPQMAATQQQAHLQASQEQDSLLQGQPRTPQPQGFRGGDSTEELQGLSRSLDASPEQVHGDVDGGSSRRAADGMGGRRPRTRSPAAPSRPGASTMALEDGQLPQQGMHLTGSRARSPGSPTRHRPGDDPRPGRRAQSEDPGGCQDDTFGRLQNIMSTWGSQREASPEVGSRSPRQGRDVSASPLSLSSDVGKGRPRHGSNMPAGEPGLLEPRDGEIQSGAARRRMPADTPGLPGSSQSAYMPSPQEDDLRLHGATSEDTPNSKLMAQEIGRQPLRKRGRQPESQTVRSEKTGNDGMLEAASVEGTLKRRAPGMRPRPGRATSPASDAGAASSQEPPPRGYRAPPDVSSLLRQQSPHAEGDRVLPTAMGVQGQRQGQDADPKQSRRSPPGEFLIDPWRVVRRTQSVQPGPRPDGSHGLAAADDFSSTLPDGRNIPWTDSSNSRTGSGHGVQDVHHVLQRVRPGLPGVHSSPSEFDEELPASSSSHAVRRVQSAHAGQFRFPAGEDNGAMPRQAQARRKVPGSSFPVGEDDNATTWQIQQRRNIPGALNLGRPPVDGNSPTAIRGVSELSQRPREPLSPGERGAPSSSRDSPASPGKRYHPGVEDQIAARFSMRDGKEFRVRGRPDQLRMHDPIMMRSGHDQSAYDNSSSEAFMPQTQGGKSGLMQTEVDAEGPSRGGRLGYGRTQDLFTRQAQQGVSSLAGASDSQQASDGTTGTAFPSHREQSGYHSDVMDAVTPQGQTEGPTWQPDRQRAAQGKGIPTSMGGSDYGRISREAFKRERDGGRSGPITSSGKPVAPAGKGSLFPYGYSDPADDARGFQERFDKGGRPGQRPISGKSGEVLGQRTPSPRGDADDIVKRQAKKGRKGSNWSSESPSVATGKRLPSGLSQAEQGQSSPIQPADRQGATDARGKPSHNGYSDYDSMVQTERGQSGPMWALGDSGAADGQHSPTRPGRSGYDKVSQDLWMLQMGGDESGQTWTSDGKGPGLARSGQPWTSDGQGARLGKSGQPWTTDGKRLGPGKSGQPGTSHGKGMDLGKSGEPWPSDGKAVGLGKTSADAPGRAGRAASPRDPVSYQAVHRQHDDRRAQSREGIQRDDFRTDSGEGYLQERDPSNFTSTYQGEAANRKGDRGEFGQDPFAANQASAVGSASDFWQSKGKSKNKGKGNGKGGVPSAGVDFWYGKGQEMGKGSSLFDDSSDSPKRTFLKRGQGTGSLSAIDDMRARGAGAAGYPIDEESMQGSGFGSSGYRKQDLKDPWGKGSNRKMDDYFAQSLVVVSPDGAKGDFSKRVGGNGPQARGNLSSGPEDDIVRGGKGKRPVNMSESHMDWESPKVSAFSKSDPLIHDYSRRKLGEAGKTEEDFLMEPCPELQPQAQFSERDQILGNRPQSRAAGFASHNASMDSPRSNAPRRVQDQYGTEAPDEWRGRTADSEVSPYTSSRSKGKFGKGGMRDSSDPHMPRRMQDQYGNEVPGGWRGQTADPDVFPHMSSSGKGKVGGAKGQTKFQKEADAYAHNLRSRSGIQNELGEDIISTSRSNSSPQKKNGPSGKSTASQRTAGILSSYAARRASEYSPAQSSFQDGSMEPNPEPSPGVDDEFSGLPGDFIEDVLPNSVMRQRAQPGFQSMQRVRPGGSNPTSKDSTPQSRNFAARRVDRELFDDKDMYAGPSDHYGSSQGAQSRPNQRKGQTPGTVQDQGAWGSSAAGMRQPLDVGVNLHGQIDSPADTTTVRRRPDGMVNSQSVPDKISVLPNTGTQQRLPPSSSGVRASYSSRRLIDEGTSTSTSTSAHGAPQNRKAGPNISAERQSSAQPRGRSLLPEQTPPGSGAARAAATSNSQGAQTRTSPASSSYAMRRAADGNELPPGSTFPGSASDHDSLAAHHAKDRSAPQGVGFDRRVPSAASKGGAHASNVYGSGIQQRNQAGTQGSGAVSAPSTPNVPFADRGAIEGPGPDVFPTGKGQGKTSSYATQRAMDGSLSAKDAMLQSASRQASGSPRPRQQRGRSPSPDYGLQDYQQDAPYGSPQMHPFSADAAMQPKMSNQLREPKSLPVDVLQQAAVPKSSGPFSRAMHPRAGAANAAGDLEAGQHRGDRAYMDEAPSTSRSAPGGSRPYTARRVLDEDRGGNQHSQQTSQTARGQAGDFRLDVSGSPSKLGSTRRAPELYATQRALDGSQRSQPPTPQQSPLQRRGEEDYFGQGPSSSGSSRKATGSYPAQRGPDDGYQPPTPTQRKGAAKIAAQLSAPYGSRRDLDEGRKLAGQDGVDETGADNSTHAAASPTKMSSSYAARRAADDGHHPLLPNQRLLDDRTSASGSRAKAGKLPAARNVSDDTHLPSPLAQQKGQRDRDDARLGPRDRDDIRLDDASGAARSAAKASHSYARRRSIDEGQQPRTPTSPKDLGPQRGKEPGVESAPWAKRPPAIAPTAHATRRDADADTGKSAREPPPAGAQQARSSSSYTARRAEDASPASVPQDAPALTSSYASRRALEDGLQQPSQATPKGMPNGSARLAIQGVANNGQSEWRGESANRTAGDGVRSRDKSSTYLVRRALDEFSPPGAGSGLRVLPGEAGGFQGAYDGRSSPSKAGRQAAQGDRNSGKALNYTSRRAVDDGSSLDIPAEGMHSRNSSQPTSPIAAQKRQMPGETMSYASRRPANQSEDLPGHSVNALSRSEDPSGRSVNSSSPGAYAARRPAHQSEDPSGRLSNSAAPDPYTSRRAKDAGGDLLMNTPRQAGEGRRTPASYTSRRAKDEGVESLISASRPTGRDPLAPRSAAPTQEDVAKARRTGQGPDYQSDLHDFEGASSYAKRRALDEGPPRAKREEVSKLGRQLMSLGSRTGRPTPGNPADAPMRAHQQGSSSATSATSPRGGASSPRDSARSPRGENSPRGSANSPRGASANPAAAAVASKAPRSASSYIVRRAQDEGAPLSSRTGLHTSASHAEQTSGPDSANQLRGRSSSPQQHGVGATAGPPASSPRAESAPASKSWPHRGQFFGGTGFGETPMNTLPPADDAAKSPRDKRATGGMLFGGAGFGDSPFNALPPTDDAAKSLRDKRATGGMLYGGTGFGETPLNTVQPSDEAAKLPRENRATGGILYGGRGFGETPWNALPPSSEAAKSPREKRATGGVLFGGAGFGETPLNILPPSPKLPGEKRLTGGMMYGGTGFGETPWNALSPSSEAAKSPRDKRATGGMLYGGAGFGETPWNSLPPSTEAARSPRDKRATGGMLYGGAGFGETPWNALPPSAEATNTVTKDKRATGGMLFGGAGFGETPWNSLPPTTEATGPPRDKRATGGMLFGGSGFGGIPFNALPPTNDATRCPRDARAVGGMMFGGRGFSETPLNTLPPSKEGTRTPREKRAVGGVLYGGTGFGDPPLNTLPPSKDGIAATRDKRAVGGMLFGGKGFGDEASLLNAMEPAGKPSDPRSPTGGFSSTSLPRGRSADVRAGSGLRLYAPEQNMSQSVVNVLSQGTDHLRSSSAPP